MSGLRYSQAWKERFHYDGNGNILHADRYQSFGNVPMDSMDYHYAAGTNKLAYISEASTSYSWVNGTADIEDQPVNNYGYDAIGNLIRDSSENIGTDSIKWNVYGKITSISRSAASANSNTRRIDYTYDAAGNRIGKKTVYFSSPHVDYTWYVRDAQANVLNVYTASMDTSSGTHLGDFDLFLQESMLYGSSRLGLMNVKTYAEPPNTRGSYYDYFRGQKFYEISNHLGNVVTVIDDKKLGVIDSSISATQYAYYNPEIVDATDYWSFGMVRLNYNAGIYAYRYGFNGKEKDNDVKGEGDQQDYGNRIYDPRVGRFLSVDPLQKKYPELTPYQFASNRPIQGVDLDGLEFAGNPAAQVVWSMFVAPFIDFGEGAEQYAQGSLQRTVAETHNADYQNSKVPERVQTILANKDKIEGTTKQISGATKMYVATADVVITYTPLGMEAVVAEKAATEIPTVGRNVIRYIPEEAPKPYSFANWGSEYIDEGVRTAEQPFTRSGDIIVEESQEIVPKRAVDVVDFAAKKNGAAMKDFRGGGKFLNDGRNGGQILPKTDAVGKPITYREYDVNPLSKSVDKGGERVVIGSDGKAYYTKDHYKTFTPIKSGKND